MQEAQRLAYLNALGITQYVPLAPIAGAPVLPEIPWDDEVAEAESGLPPPADVPAAVQEAVQQTVEKSRSSTPVAPAVVVPSATQSDEIPELDLSRVKPEAAPVAARPKASATATRFALAVVTVPQRMRLVFELALPDAPGFSAQEHRMVSDILLALNAQTELNDSITKLFRWPMVNNPRIAADASAARDALIAFLAAAQEQNTAPVTIFFGTLAANCLHGCEPGDEFQLPESGGLHGVTFNLKTLLQDAAVKPVAWQQLQTFLLPRP